MPIKALGIVIPTHNRIDALLECLAHLERQTFTDFEVVVVDDGSTDSTPIRMQEYLARSPLSIRYIPQRNAGPARARNAGVALLEPDLCLFLGDDIFASPGLVASHVELHREYPALNVAALGLTRWSTTGQTITPFMRWLEAGPVQFAYGELFAGVPPSWKHFYTSNLSLKTALLRQFPFNEDFPFAAAEDSELGYRITQQVGLDVKFIPQALADHLHPTTFRQACARMIRVGYSTRIFHTLWPETKEPPSSEWKDHIKQLVSRHPSLLKLLISTADLWSRVQCPNPLLGLALGSNYELGYRSARDSRGNLVPRP